MLRPTHKLDRAIIINPEWTGVVNNADITPGTGALYVTSTFNPITNTVVPGTGTVTMNGLTGTNTLTVNSTDGTSITHTLTVDGGTGAMNTNSTITATGQIQGGSLKTTGAVQGGSVTDGTATLSGGSLTGDGTGNVTGFNGGTFSGNVSAGSATVTGETSTSSLTVQNDALVGGNLIVGGVVLSLSGGPVGGLNLDGNFGVNNDTALDGSLTVGGDTRLNGNLAVTGNYTTTDGNITTINGTISGAAVHATDSLTVSHGAAVDMGGNVVHGVAAPAAGTDAANKAYVDQAIGNANAANKAYVDKAFGKANEGTAIALALEQPVFLPGQNFAMRAGAARFEGGSAYGVSAAGMIARDFLGYGSTLVADVGFGAGASYGQVAIRAGLTFGFGAGGAPLR